MESFVLSALTVLVSAFVGSYLAGYFKKKGENLATHEDIDKLVAQVAAVTTTTKEIEAKITSDIWDRQKRWELRREVLFEATRRVSEVDEVLLMMDSALQVEVQSQNKDDPDLINETRKYLVRWSNAAAAFDETRLFVSIICGQEAKEAFEHFGIFTKWIARGITKKDAEMYQKSKTERDKRRVAVRAAIRKELGVDGPD